MTKNAVGSPWLQVWVKQDLPFPWTISFYIGLTGPCNTSHVKATWWHGKSRDCSLASTYQGDYTGVRIGNTFMLFDKQSCPKPLRCLPAAGIPEWLLTKGGASVLIGEGEPPGPPLLWIQISQSCLWSLSSAIPDEGRGNGCQNIPGSSPTSPV